MSEKSTEVKLVVDLDEITQHIDGLFERTMKQILPLLRPNKLMYTAEEAAEAMGVTVAKINLWRSKGLLPWIKVGTKFNYPAEGLVRFISDFEFYKIGNASDCEIAMIEKEKDRRSANRRSKG